jgi:hypothetical protein
MSVHKRLRPIARGRLLLMTAMLTSVSLFATAAAAHANASPPFQTAYAFNTQMIGQTTFHVVTNPTVKVAFQGLLGTTTQVTVRVWRQTCDFIIFCSWNAIGGDCVRTHVVGLSSTCNFSIPTSNQPHIIVMSKVDNGETIIGNIQVS